MTPSLATDLCHYRDHEGTQEESEVAMELPLFEKRSREKYQVRFWSSQEAYQCFVREVERNDLVIQDVMNNLMQWFTASSQSGIIQNRIIERRPFKAEQKG